MRERGLKLSMSEDTCTFTSSLPMRERGLKYLCVMLREIKPQVAPHAGAWIEIEKALLLITDEAVAPHAGAWIEIVSGCYLIRSLGCRSPCGSVD